MPLPPYGILASWLRAGKIVPFLGAGASLGGRASPDERFDPRNPRFLPNATELAAALARESGFPSEDPMDLGDLAKVCSFYADTAGRKGLRDRLHELLNPAFPSPAPNQGTADPDPGDGSTPPPSSGPTLHDVLASAARPDNPQVIVTTNYDSLIEDAFDKAGKPYDLVIYPADGRNLANAVIWYPHGGEPQIREPNALDRDIDLETTSVIFKMHGSTHRSRSGDHFVITEEDYVEFLSRMTANSAIPSMFYPHFRERSFLFLGYGLRDWNLRLLLKNLSKRLRYIQEPRTTGLRDSAPPEDDEEATRPSWAIQRAPSILEARLWESRRVKIYDADLTEFALRLSQEMA